MNGFELAEDVYERRRIELEALDKNNAKVNKHLKREKYLNVGKYGLALTPIIAAGVFGETYWADELSRTQRLDLDIVASGLGSVAMYQIGELAQKWQAHRARRISVKSARLSEGLGIVLPHTMRQTLENE